MAHADHQPVIGDDRGANASSLVASVGSIPFASPPTYGPMHGQMQVLREQTITTEIAAAPLSGPLGLVPKASGDGRRFGRERSRGRPIISGGGPPPQRHTTEIAALVDELSQTRDRTEQEMLEQRIEITTQARNAIAEQRQHLTADFEQSARRFEIGAQEIAQQQSVAAIKQ